MRQELVGVAHGGPTINFVETGGIGYLRQELAVLIHDLFENAQLTIHSLEVICLGLTGWWEETPEIVRDIVQVQQLISVEDTVIAQAGAFAGGPGIIVISGTGSVAYGKGALEWRTGGVGDMRWG
jgi:N-acetylglucosamine kinase-like BadF-type ATPase